MDSNNEKWATLMADKEWYPEVCKIVDEKEEWDYLVEDSLNESKLFLLKSEGYHLDFVSIRWKRYSDFIPIEHLDKESESIKFFLANKKILYHFLNANSFAEQIRNKKNTSKLYRIVFRKKYFIIICLDFKKGKGKKGKRKNYNKIFLELLDNNILIGKKYRKEIQNPLSRNFSLKFKRRIFRRDNFTCKYCGWKNGLKGKEDRVLTIDHKIPIAHGGTSKDENCVTSCLQCNIRKNDLLEKELIKKAFKDKQTTKQAKGGED